MNIVAFLELPLITDYPLSKPDYFQSYMELSSEVEALGEHFFIVRHQSTYLGNGKFSKSWKYIDGRLVESGEIQADVVFDKGRFIDDGTIPVLNHRDINQICTDKWEMYEKFPRYCPNTWRVTNKKELNEKISLVQTAMVVVKPIDGEEGRDVFIKPKSEILQSDYTYPLLLQEFIDTSCGVKGIVEGLHDFRVAVLNGEIIYSYYRTPPQGSYLANVSRGGKFALVAPEDIPSEAKSLVLEIDKQFTKYTYRFYGIDLGFTVHGPLIIEMNSRLGLLPNVEGEAFRNLKKQLAKTFISMGRS